jgi:hypothetical protein
MARSKRSADSKVNAILDDLDLNRLEVTEDVPEEYDYFQEPVNEMREERSVLEIIVQGCLLSR